MPKKKTIKSVQKRFKLTKNGKAKRHRAGTSHLMSSKNSKRRRRLRTATLVHSTEVHKVKKALQ